MVAAWTAAEFVSRLRHDQTNRDYSVDLRQLVHVSFKLAAEMGDEFRGALAGAREIAGKCVTDNLFERHIRPLFLGG